MKPVAYLDDFGNAFPLGAVKGAGSWRDEHQRNWKPLVTQADAEAEIGSVRSSLREQIKLNHELNAQHDAEIERAVRVALTMVINYYTGYGNAHQRPTVADVLARLKALADVPQPAQEQT